MSGCDLMYCTFPKCGCHAHSAGNHTNQNPPPERMNGGAADSSKPSPETAPARGTTPRTKELFDGIKARRNARGFHMPQDIDDAEKSHAQLERELSSAQEQIELAFQMLELCGVPRERARAVANGIDVLVTRMSREVQGAQEQIAALREAAGAVLNRWDSTFWKWDANTPTAQLMGDLRAALAATRKEEGNG